MRFVRPPSRRDGRASRPQSYADLLDFGFGGVCAPLSPTARYWLTRSSSPPRHLLLLSDAESSSGYVLGDWETADTVPISVSVGGRRYVGPTSPGGDRL